TLIGGGERFDTFTSDDPGPGIYEIWRGATAGLRKRLKRLRDRSHRAAFALTSGTVAWRRAQGRKLRRLLAANPRILFVCRGNICRSPFAELYARRRLDQAGLTSIEPTSAGSYPVVGRSAPDAARQVSKEFGVPLEAHRSSVLELGVTSWAGAIVCMDERDTHGLRAAFPETRNRLLYLGAFRPRSEEHTSELQSLTNLVCRLLLEKKKKQHTEVIYDADPWPTTEVKANQRDATSWADRETDSEQREAHASGNTQTWCSGLERHTSLHDLHSANRTCAEDRLCRRRLYTHCITPAQTLSGNYHLLSIPSVPPIILLLPPLPHSLFFFLIEPPPPEFSPFPLPAPLPI